MLGCYRPIAKQVSQEFFGLCSDGAILDRPGVSSQRLIGRKSYVLRIPNDVRGGHGAFRIADYSFLDAVRETLRRWGEVVLGMQQQTPVVVCVFDHSEGMRGAPTNAIEPMNRCNALVFVLAPALLK